MKEKLKALYKKARFANSEKIVCVGKNKTGTTSISKNFKQKGYKLGPQKTSEQFIFNWNLNRFEPIIEFVKHQGEFFQDIPFSLPHAFKVLEEEIHQAKFILTVRDSPEDWYNSLINFQSKLWGDGHLPTKSNLMNAEYRYTVLPGKHLD